MRKLTLAAVALPLSLLIAATADAGNLYRYKNDKGVMVMESSIPPEFASKGYQIISPAGRVIETVAPVANDPASEAARREKVAQEAQLTKRDSELRKLYSSPQDAERLRDRQMDAITLKIDFARSQMSQTIGKRKAELEQAARMERGGNPVPQPLKDSIARYNRQVADQEAQIKVLEADREKIRLDFEPVIERLKVIYPNKVAPAAAAPATPAAPATAAKPATVAPAVPATPAKPAAKAPATP